MLIVLATDIIVFLVFASIVFFAFAIRKEGYARNAWMELRRRKLAMASLAILALYGAVALFDSIRWRDPVTDEKGGIMRSVDGSIIYNPEPFSLLDRVFEDLRTSTEKTFSAPLAGWQFVKETMEQADGKVVRDYPPLRYPQGHLLGTDKVGNDVLFMAIKGIRTGIVIGTGTTLIVIPFAILFGVLAGFYGGIMDDIIQYIYTTLSSIPGVLLIAAFMLLFGAEGYQGGLVKETDTVLAVFVPNDRLFWLCLIMGITSWTDLCRLIRGETLKLREMEYVQAAFAFGVSRTRIIVRHLVPNVIHLVIITAVLQFSGLVLAEAILSYIGIGVGPEMGSWGNMINTARLELGRDPVVWWNLIAAFVFMFALVLPANIVADAVRDALDPRLRTR
ncbi:MAG: ABC transporter permease [Deltaproteobacteria bacterium]|nr:ABC transporter permease [Deltaproteobacteria bacterium]